MFKISIMILAQQFFSVNYFFNFCFTSTNFFFSCAANDDFFFLWLLLFFLLLFPLLRNASRKACPIFCCASSLLNTYHRLVFSTSLICERSKQQNLLSPYYLNKHSPSFLFFLLVFFVIHPSPGKSYLGRSSHCKDLTRSNCCIAGNLIKYRYLLSSIVTCS
jgi:hypothetical protein